MKNTLAKKNKKRKPLNPRIEVVEIDEEIIVQEILPRLPTKSLCRFKSVCKNWLNLITNDPFFFANHSQKFTTTTATNPTFFSYKTALFFDQRSQFEWPKPPFITMAAALGSTNGFIYGMCSFLSQIFICNPITKHTVYVPNPNKEFHPIALACNPYNPSLGFTLIKTVKLRTDDNGFVVLQFLVYSSKTGEWRVSENAFEFRVPNDNLVVRTLQPIYPVRGNKVYRSLINQILWFDIEKDVAGLIGCPNQLQFARLDRDLAFTEIGQCEGNLSYSRMTKRGVLEVWLLREQNDVFEWVKKHAVGFQRIIDDNWDLVSGFCKDIAKYCKEPSIKERKEAAKGLAHHHHLKPLPYSGGEFVWFLINTAHNCDKVFSFNMKTQELRLISNINEEDSIQPPFYQFVPTILPCPT